jgi:hypothetical protein
MRLLASFLVITAAAWFGCAGDSSALMSTWNDGGPGGAAGGPGGSIGPAAGGAGGQAGGSTGNVTSGGVTVQGGIRDLATTECTKTTGATCPWPAVTLDCLKSNCAMPLTRCYYSDGVSAAAGGTCQAYANCMLKCPCTVARATCEDTCLNNYATTDTTCAMDLVSLWTCANTYGCTPPATCTISSGG